MSTRSAFALAEVMVALAILMGAIVTLAGLVAIATDGNRTSRSGSLATVLAAQKMEQLLGLAWGYGEEGRARTDIATDHSRWPEAEGGLGLSPSPGGTLTASVAGFADYLDEDGGWVGGGAAPPPRTAFVRRWSILPLADSPEETLVLRVVVIPWPRARAAPEQLPRDAVVLTRARSRRGP